MNAIPKHLRTRVTEIPAHLLQRAAARRAVIEEQRAEEEAPQKPEDAFSVNIPVGSGRVVRVVDNHICRPPTTSETRSDWGPGTMWQCTCGERRVLNASGQWASGRFEGW